MNIVEQNMPLIIDLRKLHGVDRMYLFGSIMTNKFSTNSDIDFLVNFGDVEPPQYFNNYIDLKEQLEALLHRQVDLLEEKTIKNPVLRRSIERNKQLIYG